MRNRALVAFFVSAALTMTGVAQAGFFHRAKLVIRRDTLRTRAFLGNHAMETVGWAEMLGMHIRVSPYEHAIDDGKTLWRGSRLDRAGLRDLKARGFAAVIGLTAEADLDAPAADLGLPHERISILDNHTPTVAQVRQFLRLVEKYRALGPVYVHCEAGVGRTGIMVAAYRMKFDGWSAARAVVEARAYGMKEREQIVFIRDLQKIVDTL